MSQLDGPFIKRWSERGEGIRKGISCVIPEVMLKMVTRDNLCLSNKFLLMSNPSEQQPHSPHRC